MTETSDANELELAILTIYRGPLEEFVNRRDALVKQLRAVKRREDADRVKALRKPSRTAWILDNVLHEDPGAIDQLTTAIDATRTAQSVADMRRAVDSVRDAVRVVATAGARVAIRAGHPIEAAVLMTAVRAVIGEASAFADLRAGRLVELPEGGGLDMLNAMPTIVSTPSPILSPNPEPPRLEPPPAAAISQAAKKEAERALAAKKEAERVLAARADLRRAEGLLAEVREQLGDAERSLSSAQTRLDAAEQAVSHAEELARARRADLERAKQETKVAAARVREAEQSVATARARVPDASDD